MENEVQQSAISVEAEPALGFGGKLINIFTSPSKTFKELDQRPTWLAPLLIVIVLVVLSTQITFPIIMKAQMETLRSNPNIPAERMQAIEEQFTNNANTQRAVSTAAQIIGFPIVMLLMALVFYFVGTAILGGDSSFKKVFSVLVWANCISIIASIVMTALVIAKGNMNVSLSPALLLSPEAMGTKLHTFLSKFDFFTIWFLAVFAIGYGYIYKFSTAKAYTAIGVLWAIWIAVSVALSGVLKQFGM